MTSQRWLHPAPTTQWGVIVTLLVIITYLHNNLHMGMEHNLSMILVQKLYFVPVILAGFWSGLTGGLVVAAMAAFLYPHHGHMMLAPDAQDLFLSAQAADMTLLLMVGGIVGFLRDRLQKELEERRATADARDRALKELQSSFEQLTRADRLSSLGQLSAGIAHEIRNPLTAMQGAVDILREPLAGHEEARFLERMGSDIARLERLTGAILDYARPPEPDIHLFQPLPLIEEVARIAQLGEPRIDFSIGGEAPAVLADPGQIEQILLNLILNAAQAMEGCGEVRLTLSEEGGRVVIAVADQGGGIDPDILPKLFQPFATGRAEGTGLGLATSSRLAATNGGKLALLASTPSGTTFQLTLPASEHPHG
ncbi:MAG: hypothetical protein AUJ55_09915 [Proteobacteria bacterium CG1_02_64_396]|nr:MAG: hypothetical protein AUJ55_09915 [Proteobacteria bacterium CG1_02_64_396]